MRRTQLAHAGDEALQILRERQLPVGVALRLQARPLRARVRLHRAERERARRVLRAQRQLQALRAHSRVSVLNHESGVLQRTTLHNMRYFQTAETRRVRTDPPTLRLQQATPQTFTEQQKLEPALV